MDRIINIKVGGNYLSKDNKNAGARGEANVTKLRITFDDGWADYNKKITFWDARGLNPVSISLLPTLAENESTYIVPIPAEPMAEVGMFEFVIEGTVDDKVQRSFSDKLEVKDSPSTEGAGQPVPPTEDDLTQLEGALNEIKSDILTVKDAKEATIASAKSAEEDAIIAEGAMNSAKASAESAKEDARTAKSAKEDAEASAERAELAMNSAETAMNNTIASAESAEENARIAESAMNNVKASADRAETAMNNAKTSADSAEEDARTAESAMNSAKESADKAQNAIGKTSYIGVNGNWFAWDSETNAFYDTMIKAQAGSTVYVGENPPDDADVWVYPDGEYSDGTEGGTECDIDDEMSDTSENAVQNKVVKAYVDEAIKTAIGDIDKALENIIAKYGLEGVE